MAFMKMEKADVNSHNINLLSKINLFKTDKQIKINDYLTITLEMFWGLWLFPFGYLVYKSGFIPRILGVFLILNGIAYVIHCFTHLLLPNYQALVFQIATPIWTLGEISIMLWLLIKGVKNNVPAVEKQ